MWGPATSTKWLRCLRSLNPPATGARLSQQVWSSTFCESTDMSGVKVGVSNGKITTHSYTYVYTHVHIYIVTNMYIFIYSRMYMVMSIYIYIIYTCLHIYTFRDLQNNIYSLYLCMNICIYANIFACMLTF